LNGTPRAEFEIDVSLVSNLLAEQHPDLQHLTIYLVDSGWDNAIFRLGKNLCLRFPRRQVAANLIANEQIWLPVLAERLPIPIPTPYRLGKPGQSYPWQWSILPWLTGVTADQQPPHPNQVKRFVSFLRSLHQPAPANAPINKVRGVPLSQRVASVEERMQRLKKKSNLITPEIEKIWHQALDAPIDVEPTWLHGDLHPQNILVENGIITGIIDWGDITSGDLATDLASIWMLFSEQNIRQQAIRLARSLRNAEYQNISHATIQRAKGWAILFGTVLLDTGLVDNPQHAIIGERILRHVHQDG
jgi:aminoglycoside phosphotransferase (APT) family kinase protein